MNTFLLIQTIIGPFSSTGACLRGPLSGLTSWALAWAWLNTPTNPHLKDYKHKLRLKSGDGVTTSHMSITWSAHDHAHSLQSTQTHSQMHYELIKIIPSVVNNKDELQWQSRESAMKGTVSPTIQNMFFLLPAVLFIRLVLVSVAKFWSYRP